jgi:hypothetical protein
MSPTNIHPGVVDTIDELRPEWLTAALQHDGLDVVVSGVTVERVVIEAEQRLVRLRVAYGAGSAGPSSIIAKLAITDEQTRPRYIAPAQTEMHFYREIASTVHVQTPRCLFVGEADHEGRFSLLLEDVAPAVFGDQLMGCLPDQLRSAVRTLGGLHGPRWCDPNLGQLGWLDSTAPDAGDRYTALYRAALVGFRSRFGGQLNVDDMRLLRQVGDSLGEWVSRRTERFSILHGEYRIGRLAFEPSWGDFDEPAVSVVDWRLAAIGLPTRDLSCLLATSLPVEDRREQERDLVECYHQSLMAEGVSGYSLDQCWDDYRYTALQAPFVTVLCGAMAAPGDVRDEISILMINRALDAVRDLASLELV